MKKNNIYLQCGYEDECKNKKCLNCNKKHSCNLNLTLAELVVIENFATCEVIDMYIEKTEILELMRKIMFKLMKKTFKEDKINHNHHAGLE